MSEPAEQDPASAAHSRARSSVLALQSIERTAALVASDAANLLGDLKQGLQSVRRSPPLLIAPRPPRPSLSARSQCPFMAQLSHTSVEYMSVYRDAADHTRDSVSASVAQGRSFIEKCVQLDERMSEVERIERMLVDVDMALSSLESAYPDPPREAAPTRAARRLPSAAAFAHR